MSDSFVTPAKSCQPARHIVMGAGLVRRCHPKLKQPLPGLRVIWFEAQCFPILDDCFVGLSTVCQQAAQIIVGYGIVRVAPKRLPELLYCIINFPDLSKSYAQIIQSL